MEDLKLDLEQESPNAVMFELHPGPGDDTAEALENLRAQCLSIVLPLTRGYIWQRNGFDLRSSARQEPPWRQKKASGASGRDASVSTQHSSSSGLAGFREGPLPCLWGIAQFGDNLEDEWFITWLLCELTARIPGTAARVWDNDGEFLLIEAAYSLPRWLKPEMATYRVWLHGGQVHVVPLPSLAAPTIPSFPTLTQALQLVRSSQVPTLAGRRMRASLGARLAGYPERAHVQMHRARMVLPARAAAVLHAAPDLAAPAVEAFHYRDADDMRAAARMARFPPQDMVSVVVRLSRCLYAQLAQQAFHPPKGYPPLPPPGSRAHAAAALGMKLACALEMLHARAAGHVSAAPDQRAPAGGETASREALAGNPRWRAFLGSLERNGYFQGNISGSREHARLLQAAQDSFLSSDAGRDSAGALAAPALLMGSILVQPISPEQLEKEMGGAEDDDAWMRDGAGELEAELAARQAELEQSARSTGDDKRGGGGRATAAGPPPAAAGGDFDAQQLAECFKAFVGGEAGLEGAEVPGERVSKGVSFDSRRFWAELGDALGMPAGASDAYLGDIPSSEGDDEGPASSSDEGSSFFGGDGEGDSEEEEEGPEPDEEALYRAQRAERAKSSQQQSGGPSGAAAAAVSKLAQEVLAGRADKGDRDEAGNAAAAAGAAGQAKGSSRVGRAQAHEIAAKAEATGARTGTAELENRWETLTATDSDDEESALAAGDDADFAEAYDRSMARELARSRVGASFGTSVNRKAAAQGDVSANRQPVGTGQERTKADGGGREGIPAEPAGPHGEGRDDDEGELTPVDVDLNLVESLLASYAGQQGLPGPAGNLAGLMGISLPDDEDSRGASAFDAFLSKMAQPG